jgi:hypothetical protein
LLAAGPSFRTPSQTQDDQTMNRFYLMLLVACIILLMLQCLPASGQQPREDVAAPPPTVSPYVNLGFNSNGVSNYQSLVRPMLDSRESTTRRTVPAGRQTSGGPAGRGNSARGAAAETGVARRFLNYSHYYGTAR